MGDFRGGKVKEKNQSIGKKTHFSIRMISGRNVENSIILFVIHTKNSIVKKKKKNNSNDYLELKSRGKNPSRGSVTWGLSAMV